MPIYTHRGLKIRLDPESVDKITQELKECYDMNKILRDVELWENLPEGLAAFSASIACFYYNGAVDITVVTGLIAYLVGSLIRSFMYSDFLRIIISVVLGSWRSTFLLTTVISIYMIVQGNTSSAIALCIFNILAHSSILEILSFLLMPIRMLIRSAFGLLPTHQELVFMAVCNRRAAKYGITLNWDCYEKSEN